MKYYIAILTIIYLSSLSIFGMKGSTSSKTKLSLERALSTNIMCPCKQICDDFKSLVTHIKTCHEENRYFICKGDFCKRQYKQIRPFIEHFPMHTKQKIFHCHHCHLNYDSIHKLSNHLDYHKQKHVEYNMPQTQMLTSIVNRKMQNTMANDNHEETEELEPPFIPKKMNDKDTFIAIPSIFRKRKQPEINIPRTQNESRIATYINLTQQNQTSGGSNQPVNIPSHEDEELEQGISEPYMKILKTITNKRNKKNEYENIGRTQAQELSAQITNQPEEFLESEKKLDQTQAILIINELSNIDPDIFTKSFIEIVKEHSHDFVQKYITCFTPNLNDRDNQGRTAIYVATDNEKESVVKLLAENGADVNIPDFAGLSPLHVAINKDYKSIIGCLLYYKVLAN